MLEAALHEDNSFVTLTYDDEHLPKTGGGLATLDPRDLRGFMDRVRWHFSTLARRGVRYFAVGEYGDETLRPHYHLAMFNMPNCAFGVSQYSKFRRKCCPVCELVRKLWGKGHVYLGTLERNSAGYVASYVTKKIAVRDSKLLEGRYPVFTRMSRRPGLGFLAAKEVARTLVAHGFDESHFDVPSELKNSRKSMPLDRYMRRKVRGFLGRDEEAPQEVVDQMAEELSALYKRAQDATDAPGMRRFLRDVFKGMILDEFESDYKRFENRQKLYDRRRGIH